MTKPILGDAREKLIDDLVARYEAGATIQQLADETGRSYGGVHKLLAAGEVEFRPPWRQGNTPRRELLSDVVRRYERGESIRSIAASTDYSYTGVRNMLVAEHVMFRQRGGARGAW